MRWKSRVSIKFATTDVLALLINALLVDVLTLTAAQLQRLLRAKVVTSVDVVKLYLAQISKHNHAGLHLNAIISVAEHDSLIARAQELDYERSQGRVRGPFHGIPIILKVGSVIGAVVSH